MKKILYVFIPIIVLVVCLMVDNSSLTKVFSKEIKDALVCGEVEDSVYAASDLGFILEQEGDKSNCISYMREGLVVGECVWLNGGVEKLNYICDKLGLIITRKYETSNRYMIEGSSSKLDYFLEGKRENVQIAVRGEQIIVGSPIIYGSY